MSVQILIFVLSGMLAPACSPAASRTGRGCIASSPPVNVKMCGCGSAGAADGESIGAGAAAATAGWAPCAKLSRPAAAVARCCTTDTRPATVSFNAFMSLAMLACRSFEAAGGDAAVAAAGGDAAVASADGSGDSETRRGGRRVRLAEGWRVGVSSRLADDRLRAGRRVVERPRARFAAGGFGMPTTEADTETKRESVNVCRSTDASIVIYPHVDRKQSLRYCRSDGNMA